MLFANQMWFKLRNPIELRSASDRFQSVSRDKRSPSTTRLPGRSRSRSVARRRAADSPRRPSSGNGDSDRGDQPKSIFWMWLLPPTQLEEVSCTQMWQDHIVSIHATRFLKLLTRFRGALKVLEFCNRLRADGVDACIDHYEPAPSQGWPRWMVESANYVLFICTDSYRKRFKGKTAEGAGVRWEGALITP